LPVRQVRERRSDHLPRLDGERVVQRSRRLGDRPASTASHTGASAGCVDQHTVRASRVRLLRAVFTRMRMSHVLNVDRPSKPSDAPQHRDPGVLDDVLRLGTAEDRAGHPQHQRCVPAHQLEVGVLVAQAEPQNQDVVGGDVGACRGPSAVEGSR
jgi:hypothetical protein